jgi:uncharacterized membrane protein
LDIPEISLRAVAVLGIIVYVGIALFYAAIFYSGRDN